MSELRAAAAGESAIDVGELARELRELTEADVSELIYRGACRYCYSATGTDPQWRDFAEYGEAILKALDEGAAVLSDAGGYGYSGAHVANPECRRCDGSGDHWYVADPSRVSTRARRLIKGVGKHGELLLVDQLQAREQLHRLIGAYGDTVADVARGAAAGAAAGAAVASKAAQITEEITPERAARIYLELSQ